MSTPGFITPPSTKAAAHITGNSVGVFQVEVLRVPSGIPIPKIATALFNVTGEQKYYFPDNRNITAVKSDQVRILFATTFKDAIEPGDYVLVASWRDGSFTIPVVIPAPQRAKSGATRPKVPVAKLPGPEALPPPEKTAASDSSSAEG